MITTGAIIYSLLIFFIGSCTGTVIGKSLAEYSHVVYALEYSKKRERKVIALALFLGILALILMISFGNRLLQ